MRDLGQLLPAPWARFLLAAIRVTRHAFVLPWPRTLRGAWLVLRANQLWAPASGNDPDGRGASTSSSPNNTARASTPPKRRGWRSSGGSFSASCRPRAAKPELELTAAIAALYSCVYSCVYSVEAGKVGAGAAERTLAMRHSDRWVMDGCDPRAR